MSVPLATLRRQSQLVWLFDPLGMAPQVLGVPLSFWNVAEAQAWLRYWKTDDAGMMALRSCMQRSDPGAPVYMWNDDELISRLATRLARSAIVILQSPQTQPPAVMPGAPAPAAIVEPPAVPVSQILAPVPTTPPALLPVLEEVQIEGAEVLPEIEQSLEQVDITLGEIKVAPVSLEPTPSKVPDISTAMTEAGGSVTSSLDEL